MFEEYYLGEKTKKILIIGLVSVFVLILIFVLMKIFILKPKPQSITPSPVTYPTSPEEVVIKYFLLEQERNRQEAEKYLFSDFPKVEIFNEKYENLRRFFWAQPVWIQPEEKEGGLPEYQIKNIQIKNSEANITLDIKTNKMEGSVFFNFYLPSEVIFEINLIKEEDYWKIIKIDWPGLVLEKKLGEKIELKESIFMEVIGLKDREIKEIKPPEGFKTVSLQVQYENKSTEIVKLSHYMSWAIVDEKNNSYSPIYEALLQSKKPPLLEIELKPNSIKSDYIFFQTPENALLEKVILREPSRKIIFSTK